MFTGLGGRPELATRVDSDATRPGARGATHPTARPEDRPQYQVVAEVRPPLEPGK